MGNSPNLNHQPVKGLKNFVSILFSNEKEQNTNTYYNTDEPQKHHAKAKFTKRHIHSISAFISNVHKKQVF